jgi:hypothetical protein
MEHNISTTLSQFDVHDPEEDDESSLDDTARATIAAAETDWAQAFMGDNYLEVAGRIPLTRSRTQYG